MATKDKSKWLFRKGAVQFFLFHNNVVCVCFLCGEIRIKTGTVAYFISLGGLSTPKSRLSTPESSTNHREANISLYSKLYRLMTYLQRYLSRGDLYLLSGVDKQPNQLKSGTVPFFSLNLKQAQMCNKLRLSMNKHKSVHGLHTFILCRNSRAMNTCL